MTRVHELMKWLSDKGLPRKDEGTLYLATALQLLESGKVSPFPLKVWDLYESIAQTYDTTPQAIEWGIRSALKKRTFDKDKKITNKAFILEAFDELCLEKPE